MISQDQVKAAILDSLKKVKEADASYGDLALNDDTQILGMSSPFDSIAFTAFATDLEEKIEDETGEEFVLKVDQLYSLNKGKTDIHVRDMAALIVRMIAAQSEKKSKI